MLECTPEEIVGETVASSPALEATSYTRIVDLRSATRLRPQIVKVHCNYSLIMRFPVPSLHFYAATTAGSKVLIEHDHSSPSLYSSVSTGPSIDPAHKLASKIQYDTSSVKQDALDIAYTILYENAFVTPQDWWIHTHVEYPTRRLAIIFLFPENRPCKDIQLLRSRTPSHSSEMMESKTSPIFLGLRTIILFLTGGVDQGLTYHVQWKW